eukprot:scaffold87592_cov84-Cyclotella_meneghiniana.AAC.1
MEASLTLQIPSPSNNEVSLVKWHPLQILGCRVCYPKFTRHPIPGVIGYTRLPTRPLRYRAEDTRIPTRLLTQNSGIIDGQRATFLSGESVLRVDTRHPIPGVIGYNPTTYPITLVTDVEIPEYLPEHGLGQRDIPGYLPEESNYSGSKPCSGGMNLRIHCHVNCKV